MGSIIFEYPLVFGLILLFVLCEKLCPMRQNSLIMPNVAMMQRVASKQNYLLILIRYMMVLSMITALASPIKEDDVVIEKDQGYEISLLLDASGSMEQFDKFYVVKEIVLDFIHQREHDKLGLTIFADFAYVAIPLTYDKKSLSDLLEKIEVGIAGTQRTALYEALFMSSKLFKSSEAKNKIAILLTDGVDNAATVPLNVAINTAKKYGIKVYVIGVGGSGDFDPEVLSRIAAATGGKFYKAGSKERIAEIYAEIDALEKSEINADKYVKKQYFYGYPLSLALLLLVMMIYMRRSHHGV